VKGQMVSTITAVVSANRDPIPRYQPPSSIISQPSRDLHPWGWTISKIECLLVKGQMVSTICAVVSANRNPIPRYQPQALNRLPLLSVCLLILGRLGHQSTVSRRYENVTP
jgi:hypothetical protein